MEGGREYTTNPSVGNVGVTHQGVQYASNPGAEMPENIRNTAAIINTSASHTYGNALSVVEKYILDMFPKDTFKTITATTTLASRQLTHTPSQLIKREVPMMVLAPRISFGQEDNRFLAHTLMNSRFTNQFNTWGEGSLIPLALDKKNKVDIRGHYNRALMYVDIVLSFNTYTEQTNWMSYLHNMTPIGHNFFIKAPLELYLPGSFCDLIGNLVGTEVQDDTNSVQPFLSYMNSVWYHPITYKLKGSSNTNEFFMYYIADIDAVIQEPQAGPGIKDGQIKRNFDISFTVRCEFNTIGYFVAASPNIKEPLRLASKEADVIVPIFTDVIDVSDFHLPVGWIILGFPIFKLGIGESSVSIDPILNQSLRTLIDHHLSFGIPMERFIMIQFRENGSILQDEAYRIDWANRELIVVHPDYHRTYRLLISVSYEYVNVMIGDLYGLE